MWRIATHSLGSVIGCTQAKPSKFLACGNRATFLTNVGNNSGVDRRAIVVRRRVVIGLVRVMQPLLGWVVHLYGPGGSRIT